MKSIVVFLALCAVFPLAAQPSNPSVVEIPFQIPMQRLYDEAEKQVPRQTGHWHRWQRRHGVDNKYRAWRGPLTMNFNGDVLTVQAHVRYWVQARKSLFGVVLNGDCGVDEAPRQAVIGLQMRFAWNPDWTLSPQFRVLPTRFLDRCEMTVADIDVTPLIGETFQQQMRENLRLALARLRPDMLAIRDKAAAAWEALKQPLDLGGGNWLALHPQAAALSPLYGRDGHANVQLALVLRPQLTWGEQPGNGRVPLPYLQPVFPRGDGLRFDLAVDFDYSQLSEQVSSYLRSRSFQVKDYGFGIAAVELYGREGELNAKLTLTGGAEGAAEIWGAVGFDADTQALTIAELDFVFEPLNGDLYAVAGMFYETIRQAMTDAANDMLARETARLRERLVVTLARAVPKASVVNLERIRLDTVKLVFGENGLRLEGVAAGAVSIRL